MVPLVLLYIVVTAQTLRSGAAASADAFARGGVHGGGQEEEGQDDKIMQRPLEAQIKFLDSLLSKAKRKAEKGIEITPVHVKNNFWAKRK